MAIKIIKEIYKGTPPYMVGDGFKVSNYIPGIKDYSGNELSPFLVFDYNAPLTVSPNNVRKGVGEHPHRGFETVTIAFEGEIEHRDSHGGGGVIKSGDIQWMTAASGLMHDEFQTEEFVRNGGIQHFIQLWINLPAKYKTERPAYQAIEANQIPHVSLDNQGSYVRVIAGKYGETKGIAHSYTPVNMFDFRLKSGAKFNFDSAKEFNTMLLVTKGEVKINNNETLKHKDWAVFEQSGNEVTIEANEESMVFFIAGEPINEPIARYGPFVMNTQMEIMQAIHDVQNGKFGNIEVSK